MFLRKSSWHPDVQIFFIKVCVLLKIENLLLLIGKVEFKHGLFSFALRLFHQPLYVRFFGRCFSAKVDLVFYKVIEIFTKELVKLGIFYSQLLIWFQLNFSLLGSPTSLFVFGEILELAWIGSKAITDNIIEFYFHPRIR
jgi:hypothetical protein